MSCYKADCLIIEAAHTHTVNEDLVWLMTDVPCHNIIVFAVSILSTLCVVITIIIPQIIHQISHIQLVNQSLVISTILGCTSFMPLCSLSNVIMHAGFILLYTSILLMLQTIQEYKALNCLQCVM